eukprot:354073-Chlamydomonas_euryale.AAC.2
MAAPTLSHTRHPTTPRALRNHAPRHHCRLRVTRTKMATCSTTLASTTSWLYTFSHLSLQPPLGAARHCARHRRRHICGPHAPKWLRARRRRYPPRRAAGCARNAAGARLLRQVWRAVVLPALLEMPPGRSRYGLCIRTSRGGAGGGGKGRWARGKV